MMGYNTDIRKYSSNELDCLFEDLESVNKATKVLIDKCNNKFDNFKKLHDIEVNRLRGCKNLSSIAI